MSDYNVKGTIIKFKDVQTGESKTGSQWSKQEFLIDTKAEYDNIICFEVFGDEWVSNLTKFSAVGDEVNVNFNIKVNEWNGKHFTSLSSWRIEKIESKNTITENVDVVAESNDLPF